MTQVTRKTTSLKPSEQTERWFVVDAKDQVLGRLATKVAELLRDKDLPTFTPHVAGKTHVIILNAASFKVTGNKLVDKRYYRHDRRPGSLKSRNLEEQLERQPLKPLEAAVRGMLPPTKLRQPMLNRLHCYEGTDHPHTGQNPVEVTV